MDASGWRPARPQELRGFSITIGVAGAFLIVFLTVPALRVVSFIRRRIDLHVPLISDVDSYEAVAAETPRTLTRHGFAVSRTEPPWWMTAPSRILLWVDRPSFSAHVPRSFAYHHGERLDAALYPNGLLLRGKRARRGVGARRRRRSTDEDTVAVWRCPWG